MAESLDTYQRKRDFSNTTEPRGRRPRARAQSLRFVVQKHAARQLHYDFRLELDGTLKSWAVPKGPSLDPAERRLAMQVEDHPLEYADFEGIIPPGNYGAGTVIVWDQGEWVPLEDAIEGYRQGKLKFELHGEKLQGAWTLVRTRGGGKDRSAWLLIKERDNEARPAAEFNVVEQRPDSVLGGASGRTWQSNRGAAHPKKKAPAKRKSHARRQHPALPAGAEPAALPLTLAPQLATLLDRPPRAGHWLYEIKFDGYRILARIDGDDIRLFTRAGNDWTSKLRHLQADLAKLDLDNGWLDGEIVVVGDNRQPDFQLLQNAFENARTGDIQFYLFDVPFLNGHDLRQVPLQQRRDTLRQLLAGCALTRVYFSEVLEAPIAELMKRACDMQLEGLIGKRRESTYQAARSRDWIKLKCLQRQEFVIGGYTDPKGSREASGFGSLLLGLYDPDGTLRYTGRVGTGFTDTSLRKLGAKLRKLETDTMPFARLIGERNTRDIHWVQPKLVAEVVFAQWTRDGVIRHSAFHGLREDKPARTVTGEQPLPAEAVAEPVRQRKAGGKRQREIGGQTISNADRVVDPKSGATKGEVVAFYAAIAPLLLPELEDRPVSLVRAPDGVDGQIFFQKHLSTVKIPNLRQLDPKLFPGHPPLVTVDSAQALIACAQMNVLEFHTWNAAAGDIDRPDRMVFDLDPGEGVTWAQMCQAAELTRLMLDELGLKPFLKTSGGKGLHVVVPLVPEADWDTVKDFSHAVVRHLAATLPQLFVAKSGPKNRVRRIFADYLRNSFGATTVAAFSLRARARLGVSVPLGWNALAELGAGDEWTLRDLDRIRAIAKGRPWRSYERSRRTLTEAATRLAGIAPSHSRRPRSKP